MPGECLPGWEMDHVRASGGLGMKSPSVATNAARLCPRHHRLKTNNGRTWRPSLLAVVDLLSAGCDQCQPMVAASAAQEG